MNVEMITEWGAPADLDTATEQARASQRIGAAFAKWQLLHPDRIASSQARRYWDPRLGGAELQHEQFGGGGLEAWEWAELVKRCRALGVEPLCTPFDLEAVDTLEAAGFGAYKIASGDITYRPLLERVAATGKRVLLSTGAANFSEINAALVWLGRCPVTVLACDLVYPCPPDAANFRQQLARFGHVFRDHTLGYSDHTRETVTGALAVACGARVLEKHTTLTPGGPSPDDRFALSEGNALSYRALADQALRLCESPDGDPESAARHGARRSAFAAHDLTEGHVLADADVAWLRPAPLGSIPPSERIEGRRLGRAVGAGEAIRFEDLERADAGGTLAA